MNNKNSAQLFIVALLSSLLFACFPPSNQANQNQSAREHEHAQSNQDENPNQNLEAITFYERIMNPAPFLPSDLSIDTNYTLTPVSSDNADKYLSSAQANYQQYGWETRINIDGAFFSSTEELGKVLIIDIKQHQGKPAYRYLGNAQTHDKRYEPWSSSKIFAYTGAMAQLRKQYALSDPAPKSGVGKIGDHHIADLITSINSYDPFGLADGNSNAIATFFANIAGRDYLTSLFYDNWLKLSTPDIYFRGAYGPIAFEPTAQEWLSNDNQQKLALTINNVASEDAGYLPYRCEDCGLTGNKPMTTLAQAEWLKRLAMHSLDPTTAHPFLLQADVDTLFYGTGNSQNPEQFAGMTLGISTMLQHAIAKSLQPNLQGTMQAVAQPLDAKQILDQMSNGKWRVFQKIGWGPSETRSTTENVVLAFVHLPSVNPAIASRSFVVAAQVAVPDAKEENLGLAGLKMQALLDATISEYIQLD